MYSIKLKRKEKKLYSQLRGGLHELIRRQLRQETSSERREVLPPGRNEGEAVQVGLFQPGLHGVLF